MKNPKSICNDYWKCLQTEHLWPTSDVDLDCEKCSLFKPSIPKKAMRDFNVVMAEDPEIHQRLTDIWWDSVRRDQARFAKSECGIHMLEEKENEP